jgi:uncharacterized protein (TIGR03437 family)
MLTRRRFGSILTGAALGAVSLSRARADAAAWTVVIVPDPQRLATQPHAACRSYERMIQWVLDNRNLVVNGSPLNIKGFIQVGDCQDSALALSQNGQETVAVRAWSATTSENMFVAWCCGNHDYESLASRSLIGHAWRSDTEGAWSPENLEAKYGSGIDLGSGDYAVWGGVYDDPSFPRSSANNYIRLQIGGRKILVIALEFFPRSEVLNWAKALHDHFFDHEVWVTTHGYMDTRGRQCGRDGWGPGAYKLGDPPASNSGAQMWGGSDPSWSGFTDWPRLGLVTCGHWIDGYKDGWVWQRKEDAGRAGQRTQQIFCNAQEADLTSPCSGNTADQVSDVAHLMLLRIWPTSCEAYMVSTNTGKWTGPPGVRSNPDPVQLFFASLSTLDMTRVVSARAVVNSASSRAGIGAGSWVTIYGENLSVSTRQWSAADFSGSNLPASLDGVSVTIGGKPAAVYYVSPGQLNAQAPSDAASGEVAVEITSPYGKTAATALLQTYAPGLFTFRGKYAAAVHEDGVYVAPSGYFGQAQESRPARPGDKLMIFGTGFGPTTPPAPAGRLLAAESPLADMSQLRIAIGGAAAQVLWAGLVAPGEYQFNVVMPAIPDGDQPIVATIGEISSQPDVMIPVQNG